MNNIVRLPDSMQRQWRVYEPLLKEFMRSIECDEEEINYACEKLKPLYLKFAAPKQFSGDPEKILVELNVWVQVQILGLMQTVLVRDVELFRLRGRRDE